MLLADPRLGMAAIVQLAAFYLAPAVLAFLWFAWSEPPSWLSVPARLVGMLGAIAFVAQLGLVAKFGVWAPYACAAGAIAGAGVSLTKLGSVPAIGELTHVVQAAVVAVVGVALTIAGASIASGARTPESPPTSLTFPLNGGTYLVLGGGGGMLGIEAHGASQRLGVDIVKLSALGFRASAVFPSAPEEFEIWDDPVSAPCDGPVLAMEDDRPDLPPSQSDSSTPLGNYVAIGCPEVSVVLAHMKRGSITALRNSSVRVGEVIGRVGASGLSGQAKLRIYAVKGHETSLPKLVGQAPAAPIVFGEGAVTRGDRITR